MHINDQPVHGLKALGLALSLAVLSPCAAPTPQNQQPPTLHGPLQPRVSWDQGRVITIRNAQGAKPTIQIQEPGPEGKTRELEALPAFRSNSLLYSQRAFWGLARMTGPQDADAVALRKSPDGLHWETVGRFTKADSRHLPAVALPLGNGRILGVHLNAVGEGKDASYFGIYRRTEEGAYAFMDPWPMELKAPLRMQVAPPGQRPYQAYNPALNVISGAAADFLWGVVTTPRHHVLLHATSGIAWVFDTEEGQLRRVAPLYPAMLEHLDDLSAIERVFLAWQADHAGRVLLASRSEEAVFHARALTAKAVAEVGSAPATPNLKSNPEAWEAYRTGMERYAKRMQEAQLEGLRAFPTLHWWSFDPEDGTYAPAAAPEGAPAGLDEATELQRLLLSATPDGVIRAGRAARPQEAKPKAPKTKLAEAPATVP